MILIKEEAQADQDTREEIVQGAEEKDRDTRMENTREDPTAVEDHAADRATKDP